VSKSSIQETSLAAETQKGGRFGIIICQILGLAAFVLVVYTVLGGRKFPMLCALAIFPVIFMITKPSLIPYIFIASFFTGFRFYTHGYMFTVIIPDVMVLVLIFAFISHSKIDFKTVFNEQRHLFTVLMLFILWTITGYLVNFYFREMFVNFVSASYIYKISQLAVIVVLFSQPQWKPHREKVLFFYVICVCFEIIAAIGLEILGGARSLSGFQRMVGTLGDHHGALSNVLILSFGVCSGAYFILNERFKRVFAACVGVACLGTMFLSGSRGSMMGLLLSMPAAALLGFRLKRNTLILIIIASVIAFIIFWLSPLKEAVVNIVNVQTGDQATMSAYGRFVIWERVYQHALYGPWLQKIFGLGIGTFNTLHFGYFVEIGTFAPAAHNNIMHTFVETGIVGMILWLCIFTVIVYRLAVRSKRGDNAARCFLVATLALLFSCMTQETFWIIPSFGRFWLMYMFFYMMMFNFREEKVSLCRE